MTIPTYGNQQSFGDITSDSSLNPQTENGLHRKLFENMDRLINLINQRSPGYITYHTMLKNFHLPTEQVAINNGYNVKMRNPKWLEVNPNIAGHDFGSKTFASFIDYQFERQKYCVYLWSNKFGTPLNFPVTQRDDSYFPSVTQTSSKIYFKGVVHAPDTIETSLRPTKHFP